MTDSTEFDFVNSPATTSEDAPEATTPKVRKQREHTVIKRHLTDTEQSNVIAAIASGRLRLAELATEFNEDEAEPLTVGHIKKFITMASRDMTKFINEFESVNSSIIPTDENIGFITLFKSFLEQEQNVSTKVERVKKVKKASFLDRVATYATVLSSVAEQDSE